MQSVERSAFGDLCKLLPAFFCHTLFVIITLELIPVVHAINSYLFGTNLSLKTSDRLFKVSSLRGGNSVYRALISEALQAGRQNCPAGTSYYSRHQFSTLSNIWTLFAIIFHAMS